MEHYLETNSYLNPLQKTHRKKKKPPVFEEMYKHMVISIYKTTWEVYPKPLHLVFTLKGDRWPQQQWSKSIHLFWIITAIFSPRDKTGSTRIHA